tara:strand:+ start:33 stop:260 length:228 start_codon:yes stop_codon:yes gene_type:complete
MELNEDNVCMSKKRYTWPIIDATTKNRHKSNKLFDKGVLHLQHLRMNQFTKHILCFILAGTYAALAACIAYHFLV